MQYSGFVVNYLDICPKFAGVVLGMGNTLSCMVSEIHTKGLFLELLGLMDAQKISESERVRVLGE